MASTNRETLTNTNGTPDRGHGNLDESERGSQAYSTDGFIDDEESLSAVLARARKAARAEAEVAAQAESNAGSDPNPDAEAKSEAGTKSEPESEDEYLKRETVRAMLSHVIDPEVGLDILTMGLIYDVDVSEPGVIRVEMTLTTKGCPMSAYITSAAEQTLKQVYPDDDIHLYLVWDPPWSPDMINRDGLDLLQR